MIKSAPLGLLLSTMVGVTVVMAQTRFGGDDAPLGVIPPDAPKGPVAKCENHAMKAMNRLIGGVYKCHASRAAGKLASAYEDLSCEKTVLTKFEQIDRTVCPCVCPQCTGAALLYNIDHELSRIYCAPGASFSSRETGYIPTDAPGGPITKCENAVVKAVGKLWGAMNNCLIGRVRGKFADDGEEEGCEAAAVVKFLKRDTSGCTSCTNLYGLADWVGSTAERLGASDMYCCGLRDAFPCNTNSDCCVGMVCAASGLCE